MKKRQSSLDKAALLMLAGLLPLTGSGIPAASAQEESGLAEEIHRGDPGDKDDAAAVDEAENQEEGQKGERDEDSGDVDRDVEAAEGAGDASEEAADAGEQGTRSDEAPAAKAEDDRSQE